MDPMHKKLLEFFTTQKKGKLLDGGTGDGSLSTEIHKLGFSVDSCDIDPKLFKGKTRFKKANLNEKFPYKDKTFDYVVLTEVIEHLENPHQTVRECNRILKPNGKVIITTPNITNIFSRLKFLINGEFFCFSKPERDSRFGHITPVPHWLMEDIFRRYGFKLTEIMTNNYLSVQGSRASMKKLASNLLHTIIYPVIRPKNKEILKGDNLIFVAKKVKLYRKNTIME